MADCIRWLWLSENVHFGYPVGYAFFDDEIRNGKVDCESPYL